MVPTFVRLFDKKIVTISLVDSTSHSLSCGGLYIKFFAGEYTERNMVLACSPLNYGNISQHICEILLRSYSKLAGLTQTRHIWWNTSH